MNTSVSKVFHKTPIETSLVLGNRALRDGDYEAAIDYYLLAKNEMPGLDKIITANLTLARHWKLKSTQNITHGVSPFLPEKQSIVTYTDESKDNDVFDVNYYMANNPDVVDSGINIESHYWHNGEAEGRRPNAYFDPVFYSRLNADVRLAGISPFGHFMESGKKEGRLGQLPMGNINRVILQTAKPLLFVGHDGILAGSEIVLLEILRWFHHHTARRLKVLLLAPGPVANRYAAFADIYVLPEKSVDNPADLKDFLTEDFEFAYLNTVVSGRLFGIITKHEIPLNTSIITHIHEMEKVLDIFPNELDHLKRHTHHWISASPASTETLINIHNLVSDSVTTVPAFINPVVRKEATCNEMQAEARRELGLQQESLVVAGCGTVYWRKGTDIFIETARLIKKYIHQPIEFVWLGDGPERKTLEATLTPFEQTYIHFAGNRVNANKLLAAADVFFMSSREDPFPLVVLESAQHGIPTVCFAPATGITTFIQKDAGISVPEISVELAAIAICEIIDNPTRCRQMGDTARNKLFAEYTADKQNLKIFDTIRQHTSYRPSVSVIVPFFNHASFIEERLDSILQQSIKDIEIIAMDDCSTDNSVERVKPYLIDSRLKLFENVSNSGSPFKQWEKGVALAVSDIVWIAEGDDTCDDSFLLTLLPYFDDLMVNIAAARTEIIDELGVLKPLALAPYLEMAYPGKFEYSYVNDGFNEINQQLGAMCTLVNASGLLIRKASFGPAFKQAQSFKMCGDWLIYLECLKGGKIAYDVSTCNYFRRHSASQVHKVEGTEVYFAERQAITSYVLENFVVNQRILKKSFDAIDHEWSRFQFKHPDCTLSSLYNKATLIASARLMQQQHHHHVAFYVHGMIFSRGGIERLAAQLANYMAENGWQITIYCRVHKSNKPIYPLYEAVKVVPIFDENKIASSIKALNYALCQDDVDIFVPMLSEWLFEPIVNATIGLGIPVIASEHNDPWKIQQLWWSESQRTQTFSHVQRIHLLLESFRESLPINLQRKVSVIPNGVLIPESTNYSLSSKIIISVGRLADQKRFDRLIISVVPIAQLMRELGWVVNIYGDGELKDELLKLININELEDLVLLKGLSDNLSCAYSDAAIFATTSEFEGFGLALVEGMSYGLPAVGFWECNGPNEIILDNETGFLAYSIADFTASLKKLITEPELRKNMSVSAKLRADNYSIESFYTSWVNLLEETLYAPYT